MDIERLKKRKKELGWTLDEIADKSGISRRTVSRLFSGNPNYPSPTWNTIEAIERALGISSLPIVEIDDLYPIPILGTVVAGVPIEAQENLEGYIYISYRPKEEYFALRVHGESMKNAGIPNRSIVICHKQETADSGDIVVAMLNGEDTVKRLKIIGNSMFLFPENNDFEPIPITENDELLILGKVVEVRIQL